MIHEYESIQKVVLQLLFKREVNGNFLLMFALLGLFTFCIMTITDIVMDKLKDK